MAAHLLSSSPMGTPPKEAQSMATTTNNTSTLILDKPSPPQEFRVPIAKSFSFAIPEIWRPAKDSLLQWVNDLPGPVKHDEVVEPAHFQAPKHSLEHSSGDSGPSIDDHRDKRSRLTSALDHHPAVTQRRRRIAEAGHGIVRRVSDACRRIITPRHSQNPYATSTIQGSTCRSPLVPTPPVPANLVERPKMRFVFVGDQECGKSSLLLRYYRDTFTLAYTETKYELFSKTAVVDGREIDLELWDTSGDINLHQLQLLSYLAWDAIFLCFSVNSGKKFSSAKTKWLSEIKMYCRDAPIILLGLKKDCRVGTGLWAPLFSGLETRIGATEGNMTANGMGATKYLECSAKTGEGVDRVFEEGVRVVFDERAADEEAERMRRAYKKKSEKSGLGHLVCF